MILDSRVGDLLRRSTDQAVLEAQAGLGTAGVLWEGWAGAGEAGCQQEGAAFHRA